LLAILGQDTLQARREFAGGQPRVQPVEITELLDQLQGRFHPDARRPGDIVGGVTGEGEDIDQSRRLEVVLATHIVVGHRGDLFTPPTRLEHPGTRIE